MRPIDIVRLSANVDKRALLQTIIEEADISLVEQILAPMWKNLDTEFVRQFMSEVTGVRFVCKHRNCPLDRTLDIEPGTSIGDAKENFMLGFFTTGGTPLAPFIKGKRVDIDFVLRGGETVEFKMP